MFYKCIIVGWGGNYANYAKLACTLLFHARLNICIDVICCAHGFYLFPSVYAASHYQVILKW